MRGAFFIREALRALKRNAAPSLAAAATVLITALVLGVFIPVVQSATGKTNEIRNRIELEALLKGSITKRQVTRVDRQISAVPHVKSVRFQSKAENLRKLRKRIGDDDITRYLSHNPLPPSFIVRLKDPAFVGAVTDDLAPKDKKGRPKPIDPLIAKVLNRTEESNKILSVTSTIKLLLGILTAVLILASLMLVANTIRLSIFARRRELEVMQLVGATDWFVRWPFVVEGLVVGAIGSIGAVFILWLAKATIIDPLSESFAIFAAPKTISFVWLALVLLGSGMLVSAIGCGFTLRRFLRT